MAEETAIGKPLEVYVSKTEQELLNGEPNVLGLSTDQDTIVFNNKVIGSGAGIRYKTIRLSASSGWIRFAQHKIDATTNVTAIFGIERGYGSKSDEHYIFASSLSHAKKGYITQLAGGYADNTSHFIKKVRTAQNGSNTKPFYIDFYIESLSVEPYFVWVLGNWDLIDIVRVDDAEDEANGITRYVEFETSNGFNLDNNSLQIFRDKILSGLAEMTADIRDTTFISTSDATGETGKWYKRKATTFWNYIKAKLGTVGSLGIGTTTPTAMLEVNGGIKAKGIDASLYHFINETTSYHHYVYLLGKVKMEGNNYTAVGKLFFSQQGTDRFGSYDIAIHVSNNLVSSTWSETSFYLLNTGNDSTAAFDLVQCTYEGEEYWALRLSGIQARKVYFSGYYKNVLWMPISYYNAKTKEILNEEIYNSIIEKNDLLKRPNINGNEVVLKNDVILADTADKLTNARTIDTRGAVESTATPFDGSKNISIQMDSVKESYLTLGGKNLVGNVSPIDMAISSYLNANRFAYLKAEYILIEYSTDGGQTWFTQSTDTDAIKTLLFTDISYSRIYLGGTSKTGINKSNYQTRITITDTSANAASLYASLRKFIIRVAGAGAGTGFVCTIQGRTNANVTANIDEWVTFADKSKLQGDSGYNVINTDYIDTYGNESRHYQQLRFLFTATTTSTSTKPCVLSIHAFAYNAWKTPSTMASTGRLYSVDSLQNMIIPNHLLPDTTLTNNLGAANKSFQNVFTLFIDTPTSYNLQLKASGTSRWQVSATSGNFLPVTDSNLNIGSESLKVKEIYANRLVGVADKAAADENGKNIVNTYQRVATPIFGGVMALGNRKLETATYMGETTADKVFFLLDKFKFAYYVEKTNSFYSVFSNGVNWRDYSNSDGTPIANKLYITPNGNVYAYYNKAMMPIKAESISATKEYTTEVISIDADFNVTCLSNNAIKTLPTDILNGVMYLKSNGAVKSTAIPLNLGTTPNYPIKYLNDTTWVDATILVRVSAIAAQWFLTVPSDTPVSTEGLVLEGQITANFGEE